MWNLGEEPNGMKFGVEEKTLNLRIQFILVQMVPSQNV